MPPRTGPSNALFSAGSVLAAWLNYWLLARVGAVNLLIMGLIEPIIAILLGAWLLDEAMNSRALVGGALILASGKSGGAAVARASLRRP